MLKLRDFNSIKVQLEPMFSPSSILLSVFQFHKGTIRTSAKVARVTSLFHFNSIKVQLELIRVNALGDDSFDFNSIKVQLELTCHTVTCSRLRYFNSIKVQLEQIPIEGAKKIDVISIP